MRAMVLCHQATLKNENGMKQYKSVNQEEEALLMTA
jgi:hypothetical protein